jgi:hypothetical protein
LGGNGISSLIPSPTSRSEPSQGQEADNDERNDEDRKLTNPDFERDVLGQDDLHCVVLPAHQRRCAFAACGARKLSA